LYNYTVGVPHAVDMGFTPQAEEGVDGWVKGVAWPVLRGDDGGGGGGGGGARGGGGGKGGRGGGGRDSDVNVDVADGGGGSGGGGGRSGGGGGGGGDRGERVGGSSSSSSSSSAASSFRFSSDVVDITRATFRGIVLGHIEHERTSGHHFTDKAGLYNSRTRVSFFTQLLNPAEP
jgi:hypothetical protein